MKKLLFVLIGVGVLVGVVLLALPTTLHKAGLHPQYHGATVDLPGKRALVITTSHSVLAAPGETEAYYGDKSAIIGGVCHGLLGLVSARDRDGNLLIAGRRMTGVTDRQIKELNIDLTPLHPETELRKAGATFESRTAFRDIFATHVAVDDEKRFVTGQNQNSGLETAHLMMQLIALRQ